jgi:hypothetical protein
MYIREDGTVGGGLPPLDKEKFEKQFKNSIISEQKGKYKFIKEYTPPSICSEFNNIGLCIKRKESPTYKIGDIIDVETFWFVGKEIQAKLPIKEQNLGVPISFLQKVSDSTPIISSDSIPNDNSNLINIALLLGGGYIVYRLFKK